MSTGQQGVDTMRILRTAFGMAIALALLFMPQQASAFTCDADLDGDGLVGTADLLELLAQWGPCEDCSGDLDEDGAVDTDDLLQLLGDWGPCVFDYPPPYDNSEAEQIGLEMLGADGPLLISDEIYVRIDRDLGLIRDAYPDLIDQPHSMAWPPNQLFIKLDPNEPDETYQEYNAYFQVIDEDNIFGDWWLLTLAGNLNVPALGLLYLELDKVLDAEPNYIFGGQNFYTPTDRGDGIWRWDIDDGFWDCTDGCDCHRHYIIDIDADGVLELVLYEEYGPPYCDFGKRTGR
jgi:hypothetical protein